jgi:hypothetical protein
MMNLRFIFLLILSLIYFSNPSVNAQQQGTFSGETGSYPQELANFIQKNINPESEAVLNEFLTAWTVDSIFTPREQEKIVTTSLSLLKKNARPYPHFTRYLSCILILKKNEAKSETFRDWDKGLDMLLNSKKATLQATDRYLGFIRQLADSSSLFRSSSTEWRITSPDFRFVFDSTIRVQVKNTTLICKVRKDSIVIFETGGDYYPLTYQWKGSMGLVTWERAGFKREDVYAKLENYEINMQRSEYSARNVIFVNKVYFDAPLKGVLIDKVKFDKTPADADYPQFDSYQTDFKIKELYKQINYEGGLSMQGSKLVGTGNREKQAKIFVYRKDTLVLVASSDHFAFKSDRINAATAGILIKLKKDSIFHHGLALSYMVKNRELSLFRTENFTSQSPYFDSYHNIDMTFEQLTWKMDEPVMRFTAMMGSQRGEANFESINFFNSDQYASMQMMDQSHPLVLIRSYARKMGTNQFLAVDFANYLQKPEAQVKQLLMRMAARGFLFYDTETDMATIRPRLNDYIAASVAKIDYDVISIPSSVNTPVENAIFDLRTYDLTIHGIPRIFVSDSQNVVIYPLNDQIVMKKNRHFQFDGQVQAGLFTFTGRNFFFNYDTFKINLNKIDSLRIRYLTGRYDNFGFPITEKTRTLLEDMKGEVYIDRPDNKSGRNSYPQYPIFVSKESGHVYYDSKSIFDGVYKRENFFFKIDPFTMDSIDNFNRRSMKFDGELASAGIFPLIRETLRLQPDNSLGFQHMISDSGLPVYNGKGKFTNLLSLTNKGLTGSGTLYYLTSQFGSDEIQFFPDSLNTVAKDFTIAQKLSETQFPNVKSNNVSVHWIPAEDVLYAGMTDNRFNMYNPQTSLAGTLKLQPTGLTGDGRLFMEGADLTSNLFAFRANVAEADTSDFFLKSLHSEGFTVLTENIHSNIDFESRKGIFKSNEEFTLVSFPENKYVSFLDNFEWDMNNKILAMGVTNGSQSQNQNQKDEETLIGPRYISTDPDQDSLSFISPVAYYDYDSNLIKATDVKYIDIADARIYPDQNKLTVQPDAKLRTLYKANIIANRNTKYFSLYNSTINITSKNKYLGSAYYNYVDEIKEEHPVYFSSLGVDDNIQTIGNGVIEADADFTLSPNYKYQGKVYLEAAKHFLTFDGSALVEHNCEMIPTRWMHFRSEIDPMNIYIPVGEDLIDIERNKIFNGLYMYYDSVHVYPTFLSGRKFSSDVPVSTATGFLYYNHEKQEYQIGAREKLLDPTVPGNLLTLHRENCTLYGEGKLDLGAKLGQMSLTTVGNMTHNSIENKTEMNVMLGIDFFMPENILGVMATEIDSFPNLPAVDLNNPVITKGTVDLIGKERYDAMKSELSLFGTVKEAPAELKHSIMFNELKLRWDDEANSWVSVGKIGIASINNVQVNKRVDGLLELQIKRSGNILDFYLQIDRRTWYYFGYTRGVLQVHSSNKDFLDRIMKLKPNERRLKVTNGGESYIYMVSTDVKKNSFLRRYRDLQEQQEQQAQPEEQQ